MSYQYKSPESQGYKKICITRSQHNLVFPRYERRWRDKFDYYISDDRLIFHRTSAIWFRIYTVIMFPFIILIAGLGNIEEVINDYSDMWQPKKRGKFVSDTIFSSSDAYKKIKAIID